MNSLRLVIGLATIYAGVFVGQPLYCDTDGSLFYSPETEPWIALDVHLYDRWASCGDDILLIAGGRPYTFKALDAGPLYKYHIEDHPALPIVADIPVFLSPFNGLSHPVRMINLTWVRNQFIQ